MVLELSNLRKKEKLWHENNDKIAFLFLNILTFDNPVIAGDKFVVFSYCFGVDIVVFIIAYAIQIILD